MRPDLLRLLLSKQGVVDPELKRKLDYFRVEREKENFAEKLKALRLEDIPGYKRLVGN